MYELHKKVNPSEVIVGWYSTSSEVTEHSVLIHEYYSRETKNPVLLTIDTSLKGVRMGMKTYVSTKMGVPSKTVGTMFTPIPLDITTYEPEKVGLEWLQHGKHNPKRITNMSTDLQQVAGACAKLQQKLDIVLKYVDDVLAGKIQADSNVGRELMEMINSIPQINREDFEEMLNSNLKDLLMVVYLSNLTRTQLAINEKLSISA